MTKLAERKKGTSQEIPAKEKTLDEMLAGLEDFISNYWQTRRTVDPKDKSMADWELWQAKLDIEHLARYGKPRKRELSGGHPIWVDDAGPFD